MMNGRWIDGGMDMGGWMTGGRVNDAFYCNTGVEYNNTPIALQHKKTHNVHHLSGHRRQGNFLCGPQATGMSQTCAVPYSSWLVLRIMAVGLGGLFAEGPAKPQFRIWKWK